MKQYREEYDKANSLTFKEYSEWVKCRNQSSNIRNLSKHKRLIADRIILKMSELHGISIEDIRAKNRSKNMRTYRHIMAYTLYENGLTLQQVGWVISRDHSSVLHSRTVIVNLLFTKDSLIDHLKEFRLIDYKDDSLFASLNN